MAKPTRQSAGPQLRKVVKVTAGIDASLYVRMAAGAATRQVSHSRFVADAIEATLRDMGLFVGQRRSAGSGDPSLPAGDIDPSAQ